MTQKEVIAAIQEYATAIGHVPTFPELHKVTGIIKWTIRKHFGTYGRALAASSLKSHGSSGADPSPSPNSLPVVDAVYGASVRDGTWWRILNDRAEGVCYSHGFIAKCSLRVSAPPR
jgi:hypothetical protein